MPRQSDDNSYEQLRKTLWENRAALNTLGNSIDDLKVKATDKGHKIPSERAKQRKKK